MVKMIEKLKNLKINWVLVVRRRRCDILYDCIQTEVVRGVNINWEHMERAVSARMAIGN